MTFPDVNTDFVLDRNTAENWTLSSVGRSLLSLDVEISRHESEFPVLPEPVGLSLDVDGDRSMQERQGLDDRTTLEAEIPSVLGKRLGLKPVGSSHTYAQRLRRRSVGHFYECPIQTGESV